MKHYPVWYVNRLGEKHKITVMAHSAKEAIELFNDSRKLLKVRQVIAIGPGKFLKFCKIRDFSTKLTALQTILGQLQYNFLVYGLKPKLFTKISQLYFCIQIVYDMGVR